MPHIYWCKPQHKIVATRLIPKYLFIFKYLGIQNTNPAGDAPNHQQAALWRVRWLISLLNTRFRKEHQPDCELCINEAMVPFEGRSPVRQYLKNKLVEIGYQAMVSGRGQDWLHSVIQKVYDKICYFYLCPDGIWINMHCFVSVWDVSVPSAWTWCKNEEQFLESKKLFFICILSYEKLIWDFNFYITIVSKIKHVWPAHIYPITYNYILCPSAFLHF